MLPKSIERTLSTEKEWKTKTLVDLTSRNNTDKITEEDSDEELIDTQGSDSDENIDVYNDLCAIGIANL